MTMWIPVNYIFVSKHLAAACEKYIDSGDLVNHFDELSVGCSFSIEKSLKATMPLKQAMQLQ